ncbi:acyl-CoA thioester hydrolase/BAAT C-terminal domain-containing protein [Phenylobacterium sp.]|uniref:acyl-CoA thioester hydrolase/BAAT C-terminal domain-containing protein n=1 Tax=Phenylobacterium sp. TaxID=1871053 RepID=UPI002F9336D2
MIGTYYPPAKVGGPVTIVIGGSEGGYAGAARMAKDLADEGLGALAISYFRSPGQPQTLEEVPLETITRAVDWLQARPEVAGRRVGLVGVSKGGEAGLIVASLDKRVCAVVAAVPSSVAWAGYDPVRNLPSAKSSWTWQGKPLGHAAYDYSGLAKGGIRGAYEGGLKLAPADAVIRVEKIAGPVLLISGRQDRLWPSTPMSEAVMARLDAAHFPHEHQHLAYDTGHLALGKPAVVTGPVNPQMFAMAGGTLEDTQAARADNWPKAVAFLSKNLTGKGCAPLR